ncbi:MAG: hypothetical protein M0004_12695 [Actinomycetota bacterium]|nr:hypothetical protein [Actinomycetota bacterium]
MNQTTDADAPGVAEHRATWLRRVAAVTATRDRQRAEQERAEQSRQRALEARETRREEVTDRAAAQRQAQLDRAAELKAAGAQLATRLGNTRAELHDAVDRLDIAEAERLAQQVLVLERVEVELQRVGTEFAKTTRGGLYYGVSAGRV